MFLIGARVQRRVKDLDKQEWRRGTVLNVYQSTPSGTHAGYPLYAVRWDDGELDANYLEVGLEHEALQLGYIGVVLGMTVNRPPV